MARPPSLSNITMEQVQGIPKGSEEAFRSLLENINPFLNDTSQAFQNSLTFGQNFNARYKQAIITVPNEVWTTATLLNSWVSYDSGTSYNIPGYYIDPSGRVYLRGIAKNGTTTPGTVIFTLPVGYRPNKRTVFTTTGGVGPDPVRIDVEADGDVIYVEGTANVYVVFDSINFLADATGPAAAPQAFVGASWPINLLPETPTPPVAVEIVQAVDLAQGTNFSTAMTQPSWILGANNNVLINRISGLSPGRSYKITFLILGS